MWTSHQAEIPPQMHLLSTGRNAEEEAGPGVQATGQGSVSMRMTKRKISVWLVTISLRQDEADAIFKIMDADNSNRHQVIKKALRKGLGLPPLEAKP